MKRLENMPEGYQIILPKEIDVKELGREAAYNVKPAKVVERFMGLTHEEIATNYARRKGESREEVLDLLKREVRYFRWSGSDILNVSDAYGKKHKVVLETNSCPSGARVFPSGNFKRVEDSAYGKLLTNLLLPHIKEGEGDLAVFWDKNKVGTYDFARCLANLSGKRVHYVPLFNKKEADEMGFDPHTLSIQGNPIKGAWRYVTQNPWTRLSVCPQRPMTNPIIACLAGGRNKLLAGFAYDQFNKQSGVKLKIPYTSGEMKLPQAVEKLKSWEGIGVIKLPYSNAGQGVFTITNEEDLLDLENRVSPQTSVILQQLIGYGKIRSNGENGALVHVGSSINEERYATDMRIMIANSPQGFIPVSLYARRAQEPLHKLGTKEVTSWDCLGTNLSEFKGREEGSGRKQWGTDMERRLFATQDGMDKIGYDLEDLIDTFMAAVMSNVAINNVADELMQGGTFNPRKFAQMNQDTSISDKLIF